MQIDMKASKLLFRKVDFSQMAKKNEKFSQCYQVYVFIKIHDFCINEPVSSFL